MALFAFVSCDLSIEDLEEELNSGSFTMEFDGKIYEGAEAASLSLIQGVIAVKGTEGDGFGLTIMGVGEDGSTVEICNDSETCVDASSTYVTLDFGAADGNEAVVFTSGTIKRDDKTIELEATGLSTDLEEKTITATIVVNTVLEL